MKEISIEADQVKRSTISDLRTAAKNEGIFGDDTIDQNSSEKIREIHSPFEKIQEKYTCHISEKTMTIKLPE